MVLVQLAELSLLIPEVRSSNPVIEKYILNICLLSTVHLNDENKGKRGQEWPVFFKKTIIVFQLTSLSLVACPSLPIMRSFCRKFWPSCPDASSHWQGTHYMSTELLRRRSLMFAQSDNTHLPRKGKYHCIADLLFDWLGFSCFAYVEFDTDIQIWLNPNESNRRSPVQ